MGEVGRGRPSAFDGKNYLDAVEKCKSMKDSDVAKVLKCSRSTVFRFRNDEANRDIILKAEEIISGLENITFYDRLKMFEYFEELRTIKSWDQILRVDRRCNDDYIRGLKRSIWNICKHLQRHPDNLTIEECADLVREMKNRYYAKQKCPRGLGYTTMRIAVRSFFELIRHVSGEHLTTLGITKEDTLGVGQYATQRVPRDVRHKFEKLLMDCVYSEREYNELMAVAVFDYATGSRIMATLNINFNDKEREFRLEKGVWMIEILDKGEKGGTVWKKYITGHLLEKFKYHVSKVHDIPVDDLEEKLIDKTDYLFFNYNNKYNNVCQYFRIALEKAGLSYKDFQPTHIFRHTFAQDFLRATNYNYELCAMLGGWDSTDILKKHYGEMPEDQKLKGLKKAMGIPVEEDEIFELRW